MTTSEFNNLTAKSFTARLAQGFDTKLISLNKKINSNKQYLLVENELKKLQIFDLGCFGGKSHFVDNDGIQNYLIFLPIDRHFKRIIGVGSGEYVRVCLMKGLILLLYLIIVLLQN